MKPAALSTASELDAALDAGLLTVCYQPVISLTSGAVVAAESLVRLRVPGTTELRPPDSFIPLAEATGRVARIDRMVLALAVPWAVQWRSLLGERPFSIGVNVSVAGLSDPDVPAYIRRTCDDAGLPYDALVVEVTETVLSMPNCGHEENLQAIAALGCNVTMDDFGTGYSSLGHLSRFPVAGIKIDRRFVWDIGTSGRGGRMPGALVRLGRDLDLHVVAEGIETVEQLTALQEVGCPFAQGYLFSRPLPPDELTTFLTHSGRGVPLPRTELPA
jgi:EAL domain-containing protein (putative c-di-GMP-specific phosphodiesterase class I)